jgi:hypothetical protein
LPLPVSALVAAALLCGGTGLIASFDDFDFNSVAEIGKLSTRDRITDFQHLIDEIDLSTIDANGALAGHTFVFRGTAAFTGAGQVHYLHSGGNTIVEGNTGGTLAADFQILLTGLKTLTATDFIL